MIILYDYDSDGATLTASTEDTNFPVENIQTTFDAEVWRTTAATAQYVDFDMGTATSIDSIGLITGEEKYNTVYGQLTSSATITLERSDTGAFSGEEVLVSTITATGERIIFEDFTAVSYRYYRLNISDASLSDIRVGRAVLGTVETLKDVRPNPKIAYLDTSLNMISVGGQSFGSKGYNYRVFDASIPQVSIAQKNELVTFQNTVQMYSPFFIDMFSCAGIETPLYCILHQQGLTFTYNTANIFTVGLKVREVF